MQYDLVPTYVKLDYIISPRAQRARGLVSKIAIREAILSWRRKDFGGAGGEGVGGGPRGER